MIRALRSLAEWKNRYQLDDKAIVAQNRESLKWHCSCREFAEKSDCKHVRTLKR